MTELRGCFREERFPDSAARRPQAQTSCYPNIGIKFQYGVKYLLPAWCQGRFSRERDNFLIYMHLTPKQSRAARGWLGWSQSDLAERARVAKNTVHAFESGQRTLTRNNSSALQRAIEAEGIRLLFDEDGKAAGIARKDVRINTGLEPAYAPTKR